MNVDQYGSPISLGDTVSISGAVVDLVDNPNYVNCTVLLDRQMPPSGTQVRLDCNTQQVIKTQGGPPQMPPYMPVSRLFAREAAREATLERVTLHLAALKTLLQQLSQLQLEES